MRLALIMAFFAAACVAARPIALRSGDPFLGKWAVTVTPSPEDAGIPGTKNFDETLKFDGAKMTTKVLAAHGFGPAEYKEDTTAFGPSTFDCTQNSDKEGKIVWHGMTTGQDLTGTMNWTKKDGTVIHYDLQGTFSGNS